MFRRDVLPAVARRTNVSLRTEARASFGYGRVRDQPRIVANCPETDIGAMDNNGAGTPLFVVVVRSGVKGPRVNDAYPIRLRTARIA